MIAGLAASAPPDAQINFQSAEVVGTRDSDRAAGATGATPTRQADNSIRFWSDDGKTYRLEGFGCRFQMSTQPGAPDETAARTAEMLSADIESYRKAATASGGPAGIRPSLPSAARSGLPSTEHTTRVWWPAE